MKHAYFLAPSSVDAGLTTVSLGVGRALQRRGVSVGFYKPIMQPRPDDEISERSALYAEVALNQPRAESIQFSEAYTYYQEGRVQELMERVIELYHRGTSGFDVVVLEGLVTHEGEHAAAQLNEAMARSLGADVILIDPFSDGDIPGLQARLRGAGEAYGGLDAKRVVGFIVNKVLCPAAGHDTRDWVECLTLSGIAAGADGLLIETHPDPPVAKSDGPQAVVLSELPALMVKASRVCAAVGRSMPAPVPGSA